jgi:hypothetical protein
MALAECQGDKVVSAASESERASGGWQRGGSVNEAERAQ